MDRHERTERACEVLQRTNDGDSLSPFHLGIIEYLVNGHLNEDGERLFCQDIYEPVMAGTYSRPTLHGVPHLTYDSLGYVRWKGIMVENFSADFAHSERSRTFAQALGSAATALEAAGKPVSWCAVIEYIRRQCWTYNVS